MKTLSDRDLGIECDFVAEGDTEEEVLRASTTHLKEMHLEDYNNMGDANTVMRAAIKDNEENEAEIDDEGG